MTKKNLAKRIADALGVSSSVALRVIQMTFDGITETLVKEGRLELRVNLVLRRISIRVRPGPAVELNRVMQRLRSVRHIMSKPTGIKQDRRLRGLRILV